MDNSKNLSTAAGFVQRVNGYMQQFERCFTPRRILWFCAIFLLLHAAFALIFNTQIYRDVAGAYAWYAREFGRGIWHDVPISQLPPLNIFIAGLLVRCGIESYAALIMLATLFMGLSLWPLYRLLKLFVSAQSAAWGCLLFVLAPKTLRFAGCGLLELTRDFFLLLAIYMLFTSFRTNRRFYFYLLFGAVLGLLTLARGEGIVMAAAVAAGLLLRPAGDYKSLRLIGKNILLPVLLTAIAGLAVIAPVLVKNYHVTGYPVVDARMIGVFKHIPVVNKYFTPRLDPVKVAINEDGVITENAIAHDDPRAHLHRLKRLPGNLFRGAYELYMVFALLGIVLLIAGKKWQREYTFLIVYSLLVTASFVFFSVAYRYFIFYIPLFMVFTLTGLSWVLQQSRKLHLQGLLGAAAAAVFIMQIFNAWGWMLDSYGRKEIAMGRYIKQHRNEFLPPGCSRALRVHCDVRIMYYCNENRLLHYAEPIPPVEKISGFDVLILNKRKDQAGYTICSQRSDLTEHGSPLPEFAIFVPEKASCQ